jgi:hypothetical protein
MFGDLTVTAFLILLPTSVVVVGSIVIFPLIDLAPHTTRLGGQGGPWLFLRSNFLRQLMSDLPPNTRRGHLTLVHGSGQGSEPRYWTWLIKRTNTATQKNTNLVMPDKGPRRNVG